MKVAIEMLVTMVVLGVSMTAFACEGEEIPKGGLISSVLCEFHPAHAQNGVCTSLQVVKAGDFVGAILAGSDSQRAYGTVCGLITGDDSRECDRLEAIAAVEQEVRTIGCLAGGGKPGECNAKPNVDVFAVTCRRYDMSLEKCVSADLVATMGSYEIELVEAAKRGDESMGVPFVGPVPAVSALAVLVADRLRLEAPDAFRHLWPENRDNTITAMK